MSHGNLANQSDERCQTYYSPNFVEVDAGAREIHSLGSRLDTGILGAAPGSILTNGEVDETTLAAFGQVSSCLTEQLTLTGAYTTNPSTAP